MDKSQQQYGDGFEPQDGRKPTQAQARRQAAAALLVLAVLAGACSTTGRAAAETDQKRAPRPSPVTAADLPPEPGDSPPAIRWEKGPWWVQKPAEQTSVSITNAGTDTILLGRGSITSAPPRLTVRDLSLAAPESQTLTLVLTGTGTEDPLHVLNSCSVQSNCAITINDAALAVDGVLRVNGTVDLMRAEVVANSGLLIGGTAEAPAQVHITQGTLIVTNANHDARLIIGLSGPGALYLDGGSIEADFLQVTNGPRSRFVFRSGTLKVRSLSDTSGAPFVVGDGVHLAAQEFIGGTSVISSLLTVTNGATMMADGDALISGPVANYGTIVAGNPNAHLTFSSLTNWGRMYMTNGGVLSFQGTVSNHVSAPITGAFPSKPGAGWTIRFNSIGGLTHTLEYKNPPSVPNWTPVASTNGTGESLLLTDPTPTEQPRYYHIRVTQR